MQITETTRTWLRTIEQQTGKTFACPEDLGMIYEYSDAASGREQWNKLLFDAKFAARSFGIMKRIGMNAEGFDKLQEEFQKAVMRITGLLSSVIGTAPYPARERFTSTFLSLDQQSVSELMNLLNDLTIIKNWELDSQQPGKTPL